MAFLNREVLKIGEYHSLCRRSVGSQDSSIQTSCSVNKSRLNINHARRLNSTFQSLVTRRAAPFAIQGSEHGGHSLYCMNSHLFDRHNSKSRTFEWMTIFKKSS